MMNYTTALLIVIKLFICPVTLSWAKNGNRTALSLITQIPSPMEELGLKGGDSGIQPNSCTYCVKHIRHILNLLKNSNEWKVICFWFPFLECVRLWEPMWTPFYLFKDFYSEGYNSVRPCSWTYSIVLFTIAHSHRKKKALKVNNYFIEWNLNI